MPAITTLEALRALYKPATGLAVDKQLDYLDWHCQNVIKHSPFVVIATSNQQGEADASPRGGEKGFVHALDEKTLLIPDWPGNNRLDSFENIISNGQIGLLFLVPGVDETLRINGKASLHTDEALCNHCKEGDKHPKLVVRVNVDEAYLHCAKALMRSHLWDADRQIARQDFPSMGKMLKDQTQHNDTAESQDAMVERYKHQLY
jgi:PPOX class probable FMN-dependent enzyme